MIGGLEHFYLSESWSKKPNPTEKSKSITCNNYYSADFTNMFIPANTVPFKCTGLMLPNMDDVYYLI